MEHELTVVLGTECNLLQSRFQMPKPTLTALQMIYPLVVIPLHSHFNEPPPKWQFKHSFFKSFVTSLTHTRWLPGCLDGRIKGHESH